MFYVEPVIGFRTWNISLDHRLSSRVVRESGPWPHDARMEAKCIDTKFRMRQIDCPEVHDVPDARCSCGLYGFHDVESSKNYSPCTSRTVMGVCAYWGKIRLHTAGFKAQYARALALTDIQPLDAQYDLGWPSLLEQVVMLYDIPCIPEEDLLAYGLTFGKRLDGDYLDEME